MQNFIFLMAFLSTHENAPGQSVTDFPKRRNDLQYCRVLLLNIFRATLPVGEIKLY